MTIDGSEQEISLVVCDAEDLRVWVGPLTAEDGRVWPNEYGHETLFGDWHVAFEDGTTLVCENENGIATLQLGNLRDDLLVLVRERVGRVSIGDHDMIDVLTFVANGGDEIAVLFTGRTPRVWDRPVAVISWDRVRDLVGQIDQIEASFGPLVGFPQCCGAPDHRYEP